MYVCRYSLQLIHCITGDTADTGDTAIADDSRSEDEGEGEREGGAGRGRGRRLPAVVRVCWKTSPCLCPW